MSKGKVLREIKTILNQKKFKFVKICGMHWKCLLKENIYH